MTHWLPKRPVGLRRDCEQLFYSLRTLPLKYMNTAEHVVRDVAILLELGSMADVSVTEVNVVESALQNGASVVIQDPNCPAAIKDLRARLLPIQVAVADYEDIVSLRDLQANKIERLITLPGIIIQAAKPFLKAVTVAAVCKDCGHRTLLQIPPWRTALTLPRQCGGSASGNVPPGAETQGPKCSLDPYQLLSDESHYIDVQTVRLQELPDAVPTGDIPRQITLNVAGALVNEFVPGQRVLVSGVFAAVDKQKSGGSSENKQGLEAAVRTSYVHVLDMQMMARDENYSGGKITNVFSPQEIEHFHRLANSPDIVSQIAASIAPAIFGCEDIKRSVACMLFGGSRKRLGDGSSVRGDLHLLLLGDPSTAKSQLLKFAEKVAPRAVYTSGKGSSAAGLTAALIRDKSGNYALEGGAMVLADGGVVCIDEFDKMRDDDRVAIHEAMEQQTISIAKAGISTVLTTQCGVIAAANPTFGCFDETKETADQHNFEATILSRFDCIWLVRDERNIERDKIIAQHVLSLYTVSPNP